MIYDLETTGLSPEFEEIIQIAAVRFHAGCLCVEDNFFSFARPERRISSFIEGYTGISNRDVQDPLNLILAGQGFDRRHPSAFCSVGLRGQRR